MHQHLHDDLAAVFYGGDFAVTFTRYRPGVAHVDVQAILGIADEEVLEGRALAAARTVQIPSTQDVRADDVLIAAHDMPGAGIVAGQHFRVLDMPRRVGDGLEMEALLGSATP